MAEAALHVDNSSASARAGVSVGKVMARKILYLVTKSAWGGAQRYVYDLATRLPAGRFDTSVAAGGNGELARRLGAAGVRVIPVPFLERDMHPVRDIRALTGLIRLIRRERPDIVHLSSSKAGGLGALACRLAGFGRARRPLVILTVHGWPFNEPRPAWQRLAIFLASWLTARLADRVIVIDTADYRSARRLVPADRLTLVSHGIDAPDFLSRPAARAFLTGRVARPIGPGTALIGTIAELTRTKGLLTLVAAGEFLASGLGPPDLKIVIIGAGEERTRLERAIRARRLGGAMFLAGFIPEASRCLKGLDVFVLPSLKEGLPYALMEAMAAGVPAVASRVGGVPDLVADGQTGFIVPPGDAAALASAVAKLLREPGRAAAMGRSGRERMAKHFPLSAMLSKTIAAYEAGA